ncbi:SurA N-terminal domain-containing protein [Marivita sp. GX14005]|uniref:SurA N-terminal domain-containing protein n=1 Tax=Marivita sp. GX14005 TaxID=2942276 RepID=UPI002019D46B|nr:SurA N-terminal domain-containing protein [Marivita sp. GX14005]MCL3883150.1 SurA N-terminal domain-containing protein [Marivita sp. GX14005]
MRYLALTTATALIALAPLAQAQSEDAQADTGNAVADDTSGGIPSVLLVTVGNSEITGEDVQAVIDGLPERLRSQPQDMLVPMALDSLILRELVLQKARTTDLADDPEVKSLVAEKSEMAEEDAMLQVYLQRELDTRASDEKVREMYDALQENSDTELPPFEDVRLQIAQQLRQQALQGIKSDLQDEIEIVFYGPDGKPMEARADVEQ